MNTTAASRPTTGIALMPVCSIWLTSAVTRRTEQPQGVPGVVDRFAHPVLAPEDPTESPVCAGSTEAVAAVAVQVDCLVEQCASLVVPAEEAVGPGEGAPGPRTGMPVHTRT